MKIKLVFLEARNRDDLGRYIKKEFEVPENLDIRDALKRMDAQALRKWDDDGESGYSHGPWMTEGRFEPGGKYLVSVEENRVAFSRNFKGSGFALYLKEELQ